MGLKNGPSKICGRQPLEERLCPKYLLSDFPILLTGILNSCFIDVRRWQTIICKTSNHVNVILIFPIKQVS